MWKFGRKKQLESPMAFFQPVLPGRPPDSQLEAMVQRVLEAAAEEAEGLDSGTLFKVSVDLDEIPAGLQFTDVLNELSERSAQYGLESECCQGWTFEFTKK